ncbi:MAG: PAS domain-containing hybrid sensor histidine kinase/response regulator [Glaciecola sp.]
MFSIYTIAFITLSYLGVLFAIAFYGNRKKSPSPIVYSLALGVHCTSWAFFGTTTQASQFGWAFVPTYLGVILVMLFAFPVVCKVARLCRQFNISSLADFIGIRYQHSHLIAGIITLICFVGVVPYIALQLDAITLMLSLITKDKLAFAPSIGFYVVAFMALFAIIFGTRTLDLTEKHTGLMYTIAFESIVKLLGLLIVGIYVCYYLFNGFLDVFVQAAKEPATTEILQADFSVWIFVSHVILGICSMFCLPRQFHINFIENNNETELVLARWLFPLFLLAMSIFVLPIALAGNLLLDTAQYSTDSFALSIPVHFDNELVALTSFIGGLSGATSMVIVATLALGIMVANSLVTPLWLSTQVTPHLKKSLAPSNILRIRQFTVMLVFSIAYWYHLNISQTAPLVKSGFIALSLLAQMFPALIIGLYWGKANRSAALLSTLSGAGLWVYFILYPSILSSYYFNEIPTDSELSQGFYLAFGFNILVFVVVSMFNRQAPSVINNPFLISDSQQSKTPYQIVTNELERLIDKVIPANLSAAFSSRIERSNANLLGYAEPSTLAHAERLLSSHIGNAGARILLAAISTNKKDDVHELSHWVEEASQSFQFNHELLQSSVAHIPQGISVINQEMKLIAWNQKYVDMFDYPQHFLKIGMPIIEVLKYNASRGLMNGKEDERLSVKEQIQRRIDHIKSGSAYKFLRDNTNGNVIEIVGSPLPGGGFVTTYNDISEYIHIQRELQESKQELENRVEQRTAELNIAKLDAEMASTSKTKFLAAAGHDLMQPFNAASLFASMLHQKIQDTENSELTKGLVGALENADQLLSMLLDMTKLESGLIKPHKQAIDLNDLLKNLVNEYQVLARQKGLNIHYVPTNIWVISDRRLLNRIIQNLITNAIRYTDRGKILVGVRRRSLNNVDICVLDSGRGIADEQKSLIFDEFKQLDKHENNQGLGLGLTIVEKMSALLEHDIKVRSELGKGTQFQVQLQRSKNKNAVSAPLNQASQVETFLEGKYVLLIENEPLIQAAMTTLFTDWGARVLVARDHASAMDAYQDNIDIIIADYHLDNADNGIDVCKAVLSRQDADGVARSIVVLSTADRSPELRDEASNLGIMFLPKPVKSLALKRLLGKAMK